MSTYRVLDQQLFDSVPIDICISNPCEWEGCEESRNPIGRRRGLFVWPRRGDAPLDDVANVLDELFP